MSHRLLGDEDLLLHHRQLWALRSADVLLEKHTCKICKFSNWISSSPVPFLTFMQCFPSPSGCAKCVILHGTTNMRVKAGRHRTGSRCKPTSQTPDAGHGGSRAGPAAPPPLRAGLATRGIRPAGELCRDPTPALQASHSSKVVTATTASSPPGTQPPQDYHMATGREPTAGLCPFPRQWLQGWAWSPGMSGRREVS